MRSRDAYEALFVQEYSKVVRVLFFIVHDLGRAEELTQDAFVQLLRHWSKVQHYDQPGSWVRRVAIRLAVRAVAREQRVATAWTRVDYERADHLAAFPVAPETLAALQDLSGDERAVVVLHYGGAGRLRLTGWTNSSRRPGSRGAARRPHGGDERG